ncbi:MAG: chorismate synthase [Prevotellaceae bacterium]|jgi:chorismate synthase|nr:chorismate synthase [Prevotellaceae bacterium]
MNTFGRKFRVSLFGESHGACVGVCVDGCPAGIALQQPDFTFDLQRRRGGARGATARTERDAPELLSGVFEGKTTGAPITIIFRNENIRSGDYANLLSQPRPGHADFVAARKFGGYADYRGGGHFSGRLTLGLVAAGVIAKKMLGNATVTATILEAGGAKYGEHEAALEEAMAKGDSLGGLLECVVSNMPVGWGEPFFDSLESLISHVVFAIPGVRGVEFGSGFAAARQRGSEHNDSIVSACGKTATNHAGGVNGGISNGNDLVLRVAVKPTASIGAPQQTFDFEKGEVDELHIRGRHDTCIALRVPVILEAATAIALADLMQLQAR